MGATASHIRYGLSKEAWSGLAAFTEARIRERPIQRVLEVGAGAKPTFAIDFVKSLGLEYTLLDISKEELAKAPAGYETIEADIVSPNLQLDGQYDFVFSKMLAEHVNDGRQFHQNVFNLLRPGGRAFHFFPTLYSPPFVVNRLMPETVSGRILRFLTPHRTQAGKYAKFPAYYRWCRGPGRTQIKRLESIGYKIDEYVGFFGNRGYLERIPLMGAIDDAVADWLVAHPISFMTSFAYLVVSKPA